VCLPVRFLAAAPTVAHELASRTELRIGSGNDGSAAGTAADFLAFLHAPLRSLLLKKKNGGGDEVACVFVQKGSNSKVFAYLRNLAAGPTAGPGAPP
jgi:hypothetical protein